MSEYTKLAGPVADSIREYIRLAQREQALVKALYVARARVGEASRAIYEATFDANAGELPYITLVELDGALWLFEYDVDGDGEHIVRRIGGVVA